MISIKPTKSIDKIKQANYNNCYHYNNDSRAQQVGTGGWIHSDAGFFGRLPEDFNPAELE